MTIKERRLRLTSYWLCIKEEKDNNLALWDPLTDYKKTRRKQKTTYIDTLLYNTGMVNTIGICALMEDMILWQKVVAGMPLRASCCGLN